MPCHVKITESKLTQTCIGGTELGRFDNFIYKFLGEFLACLIMLGKRIKEFLLSKVVFIKLRGKLYKVAINRCSGKR